jgi:hypothetical protein
MLPSQNEPQHFSPKGSKLTAIKIKSKFGHPIIKFKKFSPNAQMLPSAAYSNNPLPTELPSSLSIFSGSYLSDERAGTDWLPSGP